MDEIQKRVADALRQTKPQQYAPRSAFEQWQRMVHAVMDAVHLERLGPHDTLEFMRAAGMTNV